MLPETAGYPIWHCLTLRSNTGPGNPIRQLTLLVGNLLILIPRLSASDYDEEWETVSYGMVCPDT